MQFLIKYRLHRLIAFGGKASAAGHYLVKLTLDDVQFGPDQFVVEADQRLSGLYPVTFLNEDFRNDAAFRVLHHLPFAFHFKLRGGDDGAGDRRES